jgi:hypothetical protein
MCAHAKSSMMNNNFLCLTSTLYYIICLSAWFILSREIATFKEEIEERCNSNWWWRKLIRLCYVARGKVIFTLIRNLIVTSICCSNALTTSIEISSCLFFLLLRLSNTFLSVKFYRWFCYNLHLITPICSCCLWLWCHLMLVRKNDLFGVSIYLANAV